jgi:hypothetical protein
MVPSRGAARVADPEKGGSDSLTHGANGSSCAPPVRHPSSAFEGGDGGGGAKGVIGAASAANGVSGADGALGRAGSGLSAGGASVRSGPSQEIQQACR